MALLVYIVLGGKNPNQPTTALRGPEMFGRSIGLSPASAGRGDGLPRQMQLKGISPDGRGSRSPSGLLVHSQDLSCSKPPPLAGLEPCSNVLNGANRGLINPAHPLSLSTMLKPGGHSVGSEPNGNTSGKQPGIGRFESSPRDFPPTFERWALLWGLVGQGTY
jgi:hypothetical protein